MGDISMEIAFPLDEDKCLRRECSLCRREFKVQLTDDEIQTFVHKTVQQHLLNPDTPDDNERNKNQEYHCPYCGQTSPASDWWTKEQVGYIEIYLRNIMAQLVNDNFIDPLSRKFGHGNNLIFKGTKMELETPWISPESNDMAAYNLPCCSRRIKIGDQWNDIIHCFFCGFPHDPTRSQ